MSAHSLIHRRALVVWSVVVHVCAVHASGQDSTVHSMWSLDRDSASVSQASSQVSRKYVASGDVAAPPPSIEAHLQRSTLVIYGQVTGRRQVVAGPEDNRVPMLEHTIRLIDIVKGPSSANPGGSILVRQVGGIAVEKGVELIADDRRFPVFQQGEKLILFLVEHPGWGLVADFGPASVYRVEGDTVRVPDGARQTSERKAAFRERESVPLAEMLELLRSRRGK